MLEVLLAANSVLLVIAGYFLVRFASSVDKISERLQAIAVDYHARLSVLEQKNGIYNPAVAPHA